MLKKLPILSLLVAILMASSQSRAINVLPGSSFTPSTNAPLAGLLQLSTDVSSMVGIVVTEGTNTWTRDFYDFGTTHSEILLGFNPNTTNQIQVTCYDQYRNTSPTQSFTFVTAPTPANFPIYYLLTNQPSAMEPGYTMFIVRAATNNGAFLTMMDSSAKIVWYKPVNPNVELDVHQLDDGHLFLQQENPSNNFVEMDMLGNTVKTWTAPAAYQVDNHEGLFTSHGTILYLSDVGETVNNFPTSAATGAPLATETIADNPIVEISATNSALLNAWSPLSILDPTRVTYLTFEFTPENLPNTDKDNEHANAIIDDTNSDAIIVSLRDQNTVFKFSRETGKLVWLLGSPDNWGPAWKPYLLTPQGTPFDWNWGQHAPMLTPQNTLLLYNDGNIRANPPATQVPDSTNYSSAEEFDIDETNMTVTEVWNSAWQTNQDRLFTGVVGKSEWLPTTGHVLVTYGAISHINYQPPNPTSSQTINSTMARIVEYTHDPVPQIVFNVSFSDTTNGTTSSSGNLIYRSYRVPDFYTHPAAPVIDLNLQLNSSIPSLQFTADPARSYVVQSSTDMISWTTVGTPVQEDDNGDYDFTDYSDDQPTARFYRIITN